MIDGLLLREMLAAGASLLEKNRETVDALNVFPVPDGDTGTNMSLTAMSAVREVSAREINDAGEAAEAIAKGALRGARGNSGVILSQLFRGFARGVAGAQRIDAKLFAQGLRAGSETAYKAVMKPKEGTILTVARVVAEEAARQAEREPDDLAALFRVMLSSGEAVLRKTPDMLPALKQAGVVDAGGRGLLLIYSGMNAALNGQAIEPAAVLTESDGKAVFEDDHDALTEIKFAYCTEFFIQNLLEQVTEEDVALFRRRLNRIGDCVLVVGDLSLVKVHVHTNDPGKALQAGLALGELVGLKIENMVEQRRERLRKQAEEEDKKQRYGVVAVSQGEGFTRIFNDLNVKGVVEGGQTMNPSIDDLVRAIEGVHAQCVFVLPNNGNIVLAASQACEITKREAHVIPTKNVAMGVAAAVAVQDNLTTEENLERMKEAAERVKTGMITRAIRNSKYEDIEIHEGDIIGLYNGTIASAGISDKAVALELIDMLVKEKDALITLYWGEGETEESAKALIDEISQRYPECDVEMHEGGQPVYPFILSVE
ncbi:MAG: DAK2 domain-containing protein [Oscillospiraceae bacterium]|jgi:DAK2 domain fusion protein YloV|nr:DAK2 domain-containing protein [Oscillospiraceae bacterium]